MERTQARMLLRKINQIFDAVSDSGSAPSRIEVDLLQDYTRQFYAALLSDADQTNTYVAPEIIHHKQEPIAPIAPVVTSESLPEFEPVVESIIAKEKAVEAPPATIPETQTPKVDPTPAVQQTNVESVAKSIDTQVVEVAQNEKITTEADVLFATEEAKDLSGKLRTSPIDDLSRAMGINERFLTINELFHGDHAAFDEVLRRLNDLPDFSSARKYLEQEIIPRYNWLDAKSQKKAGVFIQLIRRRYL